MDIIMRLSTKDLEQTLDRISRREIIPHWFQRFPMRLNDQDWVYIQNGTNLVGFFELHSRNQSERIVSFQYFYFISPIFRRNLPPQIPFEYADYCPTCRTSYMHIDERGPICGICGNLLPRAQTVITGVLPN